MPPSKIIHGFYLKFSDLLLSNRAPSPISNRDFCTHRTFRAFDDKYVIFNKSVETDKVCFLFSFFFCSHFVQFPVDPNFVRGWSFRTGYQIKDHAKGCTLEYMTQSDPRGWIPKVTQKRVFFFLFSHFRSG